MKNIGEESKTNDYALFKDFNNNPLNPQSFMVFAECVKNSKEEIERLNGLKGDPTIKEKLPYIISDKFRQLANALKFAIPDLVSNLPNADNCGPVQILDQAQR